VRVRFPPEVPNVQADPASRLEPNPEVFAKKFEEENPLMLEPVMIFQV
jgi:hypothetical protein